MHAPPPCNIIHSSCANSQLAAEVAEETRVNFLNAIKILANHLSAIDPTCHRHKKIPSMSFSGNQEIGENVNGIQGINSRNKRYGLKENRLVKSCFVLNRCAVCILLTQSPLDDGLGVRDPLPPGSRVPPDLSVLWSTSLPFPEPRLHSEFETI